MRVRLPIRCSVDGSQKQPRYNNFIFYNLIVTDDPMDENNANKKMSNTLR